MPKRFTFGDNAEEGPTPPPSPERRPRTMAFPTAPVESVPAQPEGARRPRTLAPEGKGEVVHQRRERERTLTDVLIDRAKQQSPEITGEIWGKIDTLLHHTTTESLIQWGSLNLAPLQQASNIQAEIANELRRINAVEALTEAKDAAMRVPTLFDRFTGKKAEHYEQRLALAKSDLAALMIRAQGLRKSFYPEIHDLHLDAVAMVVTHTEWSDPVMMQLGNSRAKTLLQAHQTGAMLVQSLDNCVQQCGQFIEQIDGMLSTTIPQWKLSQQK